MTKQSIDDLLSQSAPPARKSEPGVQYALRRVAMESRERASATRPARSRLWWLAAPAVALPMIVISTTGSTDDRPAPDFTIPVSYTTDTGRELSCSIDLYNGEMNNVVTNTAAVDYFRTQDWSGIGQRIYDAALAYERADHPNAWVTAEHDLTIDQLPAGAVIPGDGGVGSNSDCTGELH